MKKITLIGALLLAMLPATSFAKSCDDQKADAKQELKIAKAKKDKKQIEKLEQSLEGLKASCTEADVKETATKKTEKHQDDIDAGKQKLDEAKASKDSDDNKKYEAKLKDAKQDLEKRK